MQGHARLTTPALIFAVTTFAASQGPAPSTWHIVDQPGHAPNQATRLLATSSTDTYTSADGSPQHATLEIKCLSPVRGSATITVATSDTIAVKTDVTTTLPIHLDADPVISAGWANLSPHQVLIYDLRDLLPSHTRMTVDLPLGPTLTQTLSFDLSQLASTMRNSNCRRRL